ncbi:MAG: High-affinity branched-chain amino acid transport system permease protein LivH [Candidatus Heimdallarchaeota archaeon LC_3]|nr:MAG: High-affinity branched-chain amino acid transport system permease protein LivH [Candidatus Heimdallarchaeota archaeon LC_3]
METTEITKKSRFFDGKILIYVLVVGILAIIYSLFVTDFKLDLFSRTISRAIIDGLAFSMLLFLMVSGFYLIFGLADVINFAHGAFFMLGGFLGFELYLLFEDLLLNLEIFNSNLFLLSLVTFVLAMISTVIILGALGGVIEITTIRKLYGQPLSQILLTVGFSFIIIKLVDIIWGPASNVYFIVPSSQTQSFFMSGIITITENLRFDVYRIFIIFLGFFVAIIMYLIFSRTRIGLLVQAAIEDSEMVEALGTNVKRMLTLVFMAGIALAGLAGFILVPWLGANQANATTYLLYAFVIVVVGGAHYGKFEGTFFGSLIVGLAFKYTEIYSPDLSSIITFLIMALVLIFKPGGLTGEA